MWSNLVHFPIPNVKLYRVKFLYIGMKPDLTYYQNFSLHLKNFLYFYIKTLAHFPTSSVKFKKKAIAENIEILNLQEQKNNENCWFQKL